jgi:predicted dinucleotide-utilizing enzyme
MYKIQPTLIDLNNKKYNISDGSTKIIINTKGDLKTIKNNDLKSFIELLEDGFKPFTESELSNMMIKEMKRLKEDKEWGEKYMTLMEEAVKKNTKEIVIKMIQKGLDDDIVMSCSNLTQEQLDEIKKEVF